MAQSPHVEIRYCTGCRWGLRAAWLAHELLSTFENELVTVSLIPDSTGGVFEIQLDGALVWSRADVERFPEPTVIKRAVLDIVAPGRALGHIDI